MSDFPAQLDIGLQKNSKEKKSRGLEKNMIFGSCQDQDYKVKRLNNRFKLIFELFVTLLVSNLNPSTWELFK